MATQLDYILEQDITDQQKISKLLAATAPYHDATDHHFQPNPDYPAFCKYCDWIDPDAKDTTECEHTVWEHAIMMTQNLTNRMLEDAIAHLLEHVTNAIQEQGKDPQIRRMRQWRNN